MPVKITIEGAVGEVDAALTTVADVMDLGPPERNAWGYPRAGVRVTVDATVKPPCP